MIEHGDKRQQKSAHRGISGTVLSGSARSSGKPGRPESQNSGGRRTTARTRRRTPRTYSMSGTAPCATSRSCSWEERSGRISETSRAVVINNIPGSWESLLELRAEQVRRVRRSVRAVVRRRRAVLVALVLPDDLPAPTGEPFRCGRNADCSAPPARIRTCGITAYGSYLGCLASKRRAGKGCRIRGRGIQVATIGPKRDQLIRLR